jgi:hypothetical protein
MAATNGKARGKALDPADANRIVLVEFMSNLPAASVLRFGLGKHPNACPGQVGTGFPIKDMRHSKESVRRDGNSIVEP